MGFRKSVIRMGYTKPAPAPERRRLAEIDPEPRLGAHLATSRLWYTHHGIYIGSGKVVHYSGLSRYWRSGPVEIGRPFRILIASLRSCGKYRYWHPANGRAATETGSSRRVRQPINASYRNVVPNSRRSLLTAERREGEFAGDSNDIGRHSAIPDAWPPEHVNRRLGWTPSGAASCCCDGHGVQNPWSIFNAASHVRRPIGVIFGGPRCEIRCHLRADVDEHIRWLPDVA